jgi:hypothetical protein
MFIGMLRSITQRVSEIGEIKKRGGNWMWMRDYKREEEKNVIYWFLNIWLSMHNEH